MQDLVRAAAPQLTVSVTGNKVQQENLTDNVGCLIEYNESIISVYDNHTRDWVAHKKFESGAGAG